MNVRVEFTGQLQTAIDRANDRVELPDGATVATLLMQLGQRCGEVARRHLLNASRHVQPSLLVAISRQQRSRARGTANTRERPSNSNRGRAHEVCH